jgi:hypothetical protein
LFQERSDLEAVPGIQEMSALTKLEGHLLEKFLSGDDKTLEGLRKQVPGLVVLSREMTGVGFYTHFARPTDDLRIDGNPTFTLGDVFGEIAELRHGASFSLWVEDGLLHMLEGVTYDEVWPDKISRIELRYVKEPRAERLRRSIERQASKE